MPRLISRTATTVAALGALALGGSAIAGAATSSNSNSTSTSSSQGSAATAPAGKPAGRHVGANGKQEQALDAATGAKVKAAALAKVPGATVERVETDVDHGSPYEAHLVKSDGTHLEVLVNESFAVTAVNTMQQHP
jgi:uncharacterized membrane protein YkoI